MFLISSLARFCIKKTFVNDTSKYTICVQNIVIRGTTRSEARAIPALYTRLTSVWVLQHSCLVLYSHTHHLHS